MGGSCIGKIPRRQEKRVKKEQPEPLKTNQVQHIELLINTEDLPIQYPYFQLYSQKTSMYKQFNNRYNIVSVNEVASDVKLPFESLLVQPNFLPTRLYSYQNSQIKKYIQQEHLETKEHQQKHEENSLQLCAKNKNYQVFNIQPYIAHIFKLFLSDVIFVICTPKRHLSFVPAEFQFNCTDFFHNQQKSAKKIPNKLFYFSLFHNKIHQQIIPTEAKLKAVLNSLKKSSVIQKNLTKNIFFNGFCYELVEKVQGIPKNIRIMRILMKILGEKTGKQTSYHLFVYSNPSLKSQNDPLKIDIRRLSSYFQIKCYLDRKKNKVFVLQEFNKNPVLFSVYSVVLALKVLPGLKKGQNRELYIKQFLAMENQNNFFAEILLFLYLGFSLLEQNQDFNLTKAPDFLKSVIANVFMNMEFFIDALYVEFGLQLDEKKHPLRKNCFHLINNKNKELTFIKQTKYSLVPQQNFVLQLIKIKQEIQHIALNTKALTLKDICTWQEKTLEIIKKITKENTSSKEILKELLNEKDYDPNKQIIMEYLLGIRIYELFVVLMLSPNSKKIAMSSTTSSQTKNQINLNKAFQLWLQILANFNQLQFCSAELGLTVLTLQGIIRGLDVENIEGQQAYYVRAFEAWTKTHKDPRVKYQSESNYWGVLIVQNLINCLKNNGSRQNRRLMEDICYLQNILEAIQVNLKSFKHKTKYSHKFNESFIYSMQLEKLTGEEMMKWIIFHIPIKNISSIFYNRFDFTVDQEKSSFWLKTGGSSIFDTPIMSQNKGQIQQLLSNKSNFQSDIQSNSHSGNSASRTRTKKTKAKKVHQAINMSEFSIQLDGIVQWGKGVNSIPMINPYTKSFDVLKVACGNYHVVIATTEGIFGWGDNSSGQLGFEEEKQILYKDPQKQFKKMRQIYSKRLTKNDKIQISCGNEHTVILLNGKLKMWGQRQGGILGGDGQEFDSVCCGGLHTLGIRDGKVYSWGRGQGGQLGHKIENLEKNKKQQCTEYFLTAPTLIPGLQKVKKCVCGDAHSVILTEKGEVYVFGFSYQGQLGLGLTGQSQVFQIFEPVQLVFPQINDKNRIVDIYAGSTFTFVKTSQNEVFSFGMNDCFQLGIEKIMKVFKKKRYINRSNKNRDSRIGEFQFSKPRKIEIFKNFKKINQIYCGQNHCIAKIDYIQDQEMIMGWGLNRNYQISSEFPPQAVAPRTLDNLFGIDFENICCGSTFTVGLIAKKQKTEVGIVEFQEKLQQMIKEVISLIF